MSDVNNYTCTGRLTANAEQKYTSSNMPCTSFSLAVNESFKKDGEWQNKASFFNCVIWGKYGESMHKHLNKGKRVAIEGKLTHNPWEDANGKRHNDVNITVKNIVLLEFGKNETNQQANNPAPPQPTADNLDDIPF